MEKKKVKQAVALSYSENMVAPKVVASGSGLVAENILKVAESAEIPVYEDEKMATILTKLQVGEQIPEELYELVAKIMVFVGDMDVLYAKTKRASQ